MFDAAPALRPSIKILSLTARGMPSNGWLSPAARLSSAFFACSKTSVNTSRYALRSLFLFSISAKQARAKSTAVISPAASFLPASVIDSLFKSLIFLNYFSHDVVVVFFFRKRRPQSLFLAAHSISNSARHILAHHIVIKRRRLFFFYAYLRNLPNILQNIRNILLQACHLRIGDLEPCKFS